MHKRSRVRDAFGLLKCMQHVQRHLIHKSHVDPKDLGLELSARELGAAEPVVEEKEISRIWETGFHLRRKECLYEVKLHALRVWVARVEPAVGGGHEHGAARELAKRLGWHVLVSRHRGFQVVEDEVEADEFDARVHLRGVDGHGMPRLHPQQPSSHHDAHRGEKISS